MNYNKRQFTKEEFLQLPIYPVARNVPANTDFLLGEEVEVERDGQSGKEITGSMARQKENLLRVLEEVTKANTHELKLDERTYNGTVKVRYWRKLKDGNVSERGGHITMKEIIDTISAQQTPSVDLNNLIPQTDQVITIDTAPEA
jgi:hypothetical protein